MANFGILSLKFLQIHGNNCSAFSPLLIWARPSVPSPTHFCSSKECKIPVSTHSPRIWNAQDSTRVCMRKAKGSTDVFVCVWGSVAFARVLLVPGCDQSGSGYRARSASEEKTNWVLCLHHRCLFVPTLANSLSCLAILRSSF